jgi:hypothetical protein
MTPDRGDLDSRFDAALAKAARALVTDDLPRGVLDAGLSPAGSGAPVVRGRRSVPAFAGIAAAVVLLLASAIALAPGGIPSASQTPPTLAAPTPSLAASPSPAASSGPVLHGAFRSTSEIRADFEKLRYACRAGNPVLPTGPSPSAMVQEGAVCTDPGDDGRYMAAVIVGEAADGRVVEVHVKADLIGEDTTAAREALAVPLAKAVAISVQGQGVGNALAAWVVDVVPSLSNGTGNSTELLGFGVKIIRGSSGSYSLFLHQL